MARLSIPSGEPGAVTAGCEKVADAASKGDFERLADLLDDASGAVARAAATALVDSVDEAATVLIRSLRAPSRASVLAERCLQAAGAGTAALMLDELDRSDDPRLRASLLGALSGSCDVTCFPRLLGIATETGDLFASHSAALAVNRLWHDLPIPLLARALVEPPQEVVSVAAANALERRGAEGREVLLEVMGSSRPRTSALAAESLFRMGGEARAAVMSSGYGVDGIETAGDLVRAAGLVRSGLYEDAANLLSAVVRRGDLESASYAVSLLALCGAAGVGPLVLTIKSSSELRLAAAFGLFEDPCSESLEALGFLVTDDYPPARWAAACALGTNGHEIALDALVDALESGDATWRARAAAALAGLRDERAREALSLTLEDEDPSVRSSARVSLATSWPGSRSVSTSEALSASAAERRKRVDVLADATDLIPTLREMAASENVEERLLAVRQMGAVGDAEAADSLADAMIDPDVRVALAARLSLARLAV